MKIVTIIDMACETYVPNDGLERRGWLDARPVDADGMSRMYKALVHATDFLPWAYLDSCRERLVALWVKNRIEVPLPAFLDLIIYERGKSCAFLNEEQRAYIEIKLQRAIWEMAEACHYAISDDDDNDQTDDDCDDDDDGDCPALCHGDLLKPTHSAEEVTHDVE